MGQLEIPVQRMEGAGKVRMGRIIVCRWTLTGYRINILLGMILFTKSLWKTLPFRSPVALGGCAVVSIVFFATEAALTPGHAQQAAPPQQTVSPQQTTTPQPSPLPTTLPPQSTTTPPAQQPRKNSAVGLPKESTTARSESVLRRQLADTPEGYDVGDFIAHGSVEGSIEYDDNIFRSNSYPGNPPPVGDFVARVRPRVSLQSDWSEHAIDFYVQGELGEYLSNSSQDYFNFALGTHGRYDIDENQQLNGLLEYTRGILPRGSPGVGVTGGQTIASVLRAEAKYTYEGEPWYVRVGPHYEYRTFEGSAPSSNYNFLDVAARIGYRVTEEFSVFIDPSVQFVQYPGGVDFTGVDPNSQGYDFKVGITYDVSTDIGIEAAVGYFRRWYESSSLPPDGGLSFKLAAYWNPTENWSLEVIGSRSLSEYRVFTGTTPSGNAIATEVQARVGWLADDNFLIDAGLAFAIYTFPDANRVDNYYGFDIGARYFFNENYWIGPRYFYTTRTSTDPTIPYIDNRIMLTLGARL